MAEQILNYFILLVVVIALLVWHQPMFLLRTGKPMTLLSLAKFVENLGRYYGHVMRRQVLAKEAAHKAFRESKAQYPQFQFKQEETVQVQQPKEITV